MHLHSTLSHTFVSSLLLLSLVPSSAIAVPSRGTDRYPLEPYSLPQPALPTRPAPERPTWGRRLRDQLVQRVFGSPPASEPGSRYVDPPKSSRTSSNGPSPKMLARYGSDVVLRFNVSTPEEAASLAAATNTLFLDVWEATQDFVDIRLAKDVVSVLNCYRRPQC
jgi:extracellular matrix protein 14